MAKDLRFIVQRGAKLIVDGGKITNLCPDTRWGGINVHGNASKVQSSPFGALATDDAGVVIIKNGSLIEHAITAISTTAPGMSYPDQVARWGGLIYAENSEFIDNRRVAEFMKYDFPNKSQFINCIMDSEGNGYAGVTIWDTDGITFNQCKFYNMSDQGILTYDAGAFVLDDNGFEHNGRGISSRATYPHSAYLVVGNLSSAPNKFSDNWFHIESNISQHGPGLSIINNEFSQSNTAIWLIGPSRYFIENNVFDQTTGGVFTYRTGSLGYMPFNYISYNKLTAVAGIVAQGENREMQFLCNDFYGKWDFILRQVYNSGPQGEIRQNQGSSFTGAGNCFTDPVQIADILTESQTLNFRYYAAGEDACKNPLTPGNYSVVNTVNDPCGEGRNFPEHPTYEDYLYIKGQIQNGGEGEQQVEAVDLLELKDHIVHKLVKSYIDAGEKERAIYLLDQENTITSRLMKYGVQINGGDYEAALETLDALPDEVTEMNTFKQIQYININRMEYGLAYNMSQTDSVFLESVADGDMAVKGYARAILGLVFGRHYDDGLELDEEDVAERDNPARPGIISEGESKVVVYPNPALNQFTVRLFNTPASVMKVTSMLGQLVHSRNISEGNPVITVSAGDWNRGTYLLQLLNTEGKVIHAELLYISK